MESLTRLICLILCACGPADRTVPLTLNLARSGLTEESPFAGAPTLRVTVGGLGFEDVVAHLSLDDGQGALEGFPAGPGLSIIVEALSPDGEVVSRATVPEVDVMDAMGYGAETSALISLVGRFTHPPGQLGAGVGHSATLEGEGVVVAGGCVGGRPTDRLEAYDWQRGEVTALEPLTTPRCRHGAASLDGMILLAGGLGPLGPLDDLMIRDREGHSETLRMPLPLTDMATITMDKQAAFVGGTSWTDDGLESPSPLVMAVRGGELFPFPPLAAPKARPVAVPWGEALLIVDASGAEVYSPSSEPMALDMEGREGAALAPYEGGILILGGLGEGRAVSGCTMFQGEGLTPFGPMREARAYHTATALADGRVLVVGGLGGDGQALASAEMLDPSEGAFRGLPSMAEGRANHTATLLPDGTVLIAGGEPGADTLIFNPGERR